MPAASTVTWSRSPALLQNEIVDMHEQPDQVEEGAGCAPLAAGAGVYSHTIMECYCELDIPGFEHVDEHGNISGLPLPYKVTIEHDTRQVLEVRRDSRPDMPGLPQRRQTFVKFGFVEGLGFYGLGLMHLLGNTTNTMTSIWRLLLDALMFGNFPGFLYAESRGSSSPTFSAFRPAPALPFS